MTLTEVAKVIDGELIGDPFKTISGICSVDKITPDCLIFIFDIKLLDKVSIEDPTCCLILDISQKNKLSTKLDLKLDILLVPDPKLALSKIAPFFKNSSSGLIKNNMYNVFNGKNVKIGPNFSCGHNVVIGDNVTIGSNVFLNHNVCIQNDCNIGNNVYIDVGSIIGSEGFGNVKLDEGWEHIVHLGKVIIGNYVSIGANCSIDRGTIDDTIIEDGVIIDNSVHIAHNVTIGANTAIAAKVGIAGSCIIGKRNMIGGMVGIIDHIKTADDVVISASSTVIKDLKSPGTYTGIMPISNHANWKRIALWISKLDKIAKLLKLKKI